MTSPPYVAVPGLAEYPHANSEAEPGKELAGLCKALGVDAVAVFELDMGYEASTAIGGTGTASASIGSSLTIVNRNGEVAVRGGGFRMRSEDTTTMVGGSILYSDAVE